jgi:L-lactate dehydrogenase complex protein LldG
VTGPASDDRELVLARIRAALGSTPPSAGPRQVPREYRAAGEHGPGSPEVLDLLDDRLVDYRASVLRPEPGTAVGAAVAVAVAALRSASSNVLPEPARILAPAGLDDGWLDGLVAAGHTVVRDPDPERGPLSVDDLDSVDLVITGCAVAVAETGTIVLDGSATSGRRAISLVPDRHLIVVRADQVVQTVPEAIARLRPSGPDDLRPLTLVSGPSATSDIELQRVEGVHGPRTLLVVLTG